MKQVDVEIPPGFIGRLFGQKSDIERRKYATEAEIVNGDTGCVLHRDFLSWHYRHCKVCEEDTLTRQREYGLSWYSTTIDCGDVLTPIYACAVCGTLHNPTTEHRYDYDT